MSTAHRILLDNAAGHKSDCTRPRRRDCRYAVNEFAEFAYQGQTLHCRLSDISIGGAGIEISLLEPIPPHAGILKCKRFGKLPCVVKYQTFNRLGVEFQLSDSVRATLLQNLAELTPI